MFILRSFGESIGGLLPAPAALPMNLSDEVFPHSMLSKLLPRLIFRHLQALYAELVEAKKRRAPVLSDVRRLWVVYIQSPRANISNWIFASEGLYSLCVNSYHRTYYLFTSLATLRENGCKSTTFPATSKIFSAYSCKSQPFSVALRVNWGIRR